MTNVLFRCHADLSQKSNSVKEWLENYLNLKKKCKIKLNSRTNSLTENWIFFGDEISNNYYIETVYLKEREIPKTFSTLNTVLHLNGIENHEINDIQE